MTYMARCMRRVAVILGATGTNMRRYENENEDDDEETLFIAP